MSLLPIQMHLPSLRATLTCIRGLRAAAYRNVDGRIPNWLRYLVTVRRATRIPWSRSLVTISLSVIGRASLVIISFITSLAESEAEKKSLKGMTVLLGNMTYLLAVARLTVLSCIPRYCATCALVSGLRWRTPLRM